MKFLIEGGRIHDPANGVDGDTQDLFIEDGKIVAAREDFEPDRRLDARGCVVMPGGVDVHCHIAGTSLNRARRLLAGSQHSSSRNANEAAGEALIPSTSETGILYSLLGYTTAIDAAIAPSASRQGHFELADTPNLDTGFLLLLANNSSLFDLLDRGEMELAKRTVSHLVAQTGAFGVKAVNAGGVNHWKKTGAPIDDLNSCIDGRATSPATILRLLAECAEGLPHPLHVHAARLGKPGNIDTTIETSRSLAGLRHHMTHVQFNSYGSDEKGDFTSASERFIEHLNATKELSADVGQVLFGDALTISADQEVEHFLWKVTGKPYVNLDVELEAGCGIVPIEYKPRSRLHALQWIVGMELFLLNEDPWKLALSTDHPNGASFLTYPMLMAQLMDEGLRRATLELVPPDLADASILKTLTREYSLQEIAIISRAGPARILGLTSKGQLGVGADADITVYSESENKETMFRRPRYVMQAGSLVIEDTEVRLRTEGSTLIAAQDRDVDAAKHQSAWHSDHATYSAEQVGPSRDFRASCRSIEGASS